MEAKRRKLSPLATDTENVKQQGKLGDKDILFIVGASHLICIDLNRLRNDSHHVNSKCALPNAPTIFDFDQCLTLTQVMSSSSSDQYTLPNAPTLFNLYLRNHCLGSFVFHDKLFILGGSVPYQRAMDDWRHKSDYRPLDVSEIKFDSSKLNAAAEDVLFPAPTLPALNHPKPFPIVEVIGNKVYILNTVYGDSEFHEDFDFEFLDFDAPLSWTTIQNPPFFELLQHNAFVLSHFVVGSRLYLVVSDGIRAGSPLYIYYFDTVTSSWALDPSIPSSINKIPVDYMLRGKSTTVDGLEPNSILLSFECVCGMESRQLFATLVTNLGQPLCYQDIFDSVFPDILPPSGFGHLSAGVFCVGDRPNRGDKLNCGGKLYCALIVGYDSHNNEFLCMSFFELFGTGASVNEPLVKETEFLRVKVQEKFICRLDARHVNISAAFLF